MLWKAASDITGVPDVSGLPVTEVISGDDRPDRCEMPSDRVSRRDDDRSLRGRP